MNLEVFRLIKPIFDTSQQLLYIYTTKNIFQSDNFLIYSVSLHEGMDTRLGSARLL